MNWPDFSNPKVFYVVVCFVEAADFSAQRERLEALGKQNNVRLVVQPCPFEALEFLYRLNADLLSHQSSYDEHVFCKALTLNDNVAKAVIDQVADHYHAYFCALVDQDETAVRKQAQALQALAKHFAVQPSDPNKER